MKKRPALLRIIAVLILAVIGAFLIPWKNKVAMEEAFSPRAVLVPSARFVFNSFVDCNMAEVWVGDTFRIFPGKYGEDPVWGSSSNLKFADGRNADEAFLRKAGEFKEPMLPPNAVPGTDGLHGAVWFETVYRDSNDKTGKTLFALYHNENYPATLPYDSSTGKGYINKDWPRGLTGDTSAAAVCRIGIVKSTDAGRSWSNKGIILEDLQPRMILKPHNTSITFAGGVGDPSAIVSGDNLYIFYGEYGYPGVYTQDGYNELTEYSGQCISIAQLPLKDLENPTGKVKRWDGKGFNAAYDGTGKPVPALQVPIVKGGGPASSPKSAFHWGPSVSWNSFLECWVMLMAKSEGISWKGSSIYISFNKNKDLGEADNAQQWTTPKLLLDKPGHVTWYPSLQPMNNEEDISNKRTCLQLGERARLFYKVQDSSAYISEYMIQFHKQ